MKNYISSVLICGFTLIPGTAWAQQAMSAAQLQAVVKPDLKSCEQKVPIVPQVNAKVFAQDRIERTLNGVWRGRVSGNYDKSFFAKDGFLNVDYYMIIDTKRGEALVFEQLGSKRAAHNAAPGAPVWSFVLCSQERYIPAQPAQVHEFQKISDKVQDARSLLRTSTGLTIDDKSDLVLSAAWQKLVDSKYFDTSRSPAYAGGFFKPFEIGNVQNEERGTLFSMKYQAEYRGSGQTAAKFERGVPMHGTEKGQFIGITTASGDFLISSAGNGVEYSKEVSEGGLINMGIDKVIIGPLAK